MNDGDGPLLSRRRITSAVALPHLEVLGDAGDSPLDEADVSRRRAELGIGDQLRVVELDDPTARLDGTRSGRENILHPMYV